MEFLYFQTDWPFDKFLGFVLWLTMEIIGFWCLTFLAMLVPYWAYFGSKEMNGKSNENIDPELVRRKILPEQEGVQLLYRR